MDTTIVLATANARYSHTAFGLRWLHANLGPLRDRACIREFTIRDSAQHICETLIGLSPRILGLGVYIWNVQLITEAVRLIKAARPDIDVVIGGPEVSHEYEGTELFGLADYLVRGEGELAFAELATRLLTGQRPSEKVVYGRPDDLSRLVSPYGAYTDEDIARRILYVESSRGCPFRCEFCLSSLDGGVREHPLDEFLADMDRLVQRGARQFKFVDRTFNLSQRRVDAILSFFLDRSLEGLRLHFEIVPDRLTPETLGLFRKFPPGALHLEVGIQSFNAETLAAISRRQDLDKTMRNLRFLRNETGALLHADLVAGLPGESWETFAAGFDRLIGAGPHELQVGVLKRLKGAPISRHAAPRAMRFNPEPPYEVIETDLIDAARMERIKRFARYFDIYYNSGRFPSSCPMIWLNAQSPFAAFMEFSGFVWQEAGRAHGIPLAESAQLLYRFLVTRRDIAAGTAALAVEGDFRRLPGRKDKLEFQS